MTRLPGVRDYERLRQRIEELREEVARAGRAVTPREELLALQRELSAVRQELDVISSQWGAITGDIDDQEDLAERLGEKVDTESLGELAYENDPLGAGLYGRRSAGGVIPSSWELIQPVTAIEFTKRSSPPQAITSYPDTVLFDQLDGGTESWLSYAGGEFVYQGSGAPVILLIDVVVGFQTKGDRARVYLERDDGGGWNTEPGTDRVADEVFGASVSIVCALTLDQSEKLRVRLTLDLGSDAISIEGGSFSAFSVETQ